MGLNEVETLALGLLIGTAAGAVLISILRVRPRPVREIRVTVTPNALPQRRAPTLAVGHTRSVAAPPGRGGPADLVTLGADHSGARQGRPQTVPSRTDVLTPVDSGALVAFPIARWRDPELDALREPLKAGPPTAVALAERPRAAAGDPGQAGNDDDRALMLDKPDLLAAAIADGVVKLAPGLNQSLAKSDAAARTLLAELDRFAASAGIDAPDDPETHARFATPATKFGITRLKVSESQ